MTKDELITKIHQEFANRFFDLGVYCLNETIELNYSIGKIILKYDNN